MESKWIDYRDYRWQMRSAEPRLSIVVMNPFSAEFVILHIIVDYNLTQTYVVEQKQGGCVKIYEVPRNVFTNLYEKHYEFLGFLN